MPRPRNPVARNPLLRKGGAHERTSASVRQTERQQLKTLIEQWAQDETDDGFNHDQEAFDDE